MLTAEVQLLGSPAAPPVRSPFHLSAALHDLTPSLQLVASALPFPFLVEPPRGWEKGADLCAVRM